MRKKNYDTDFTSEMRNSPIGSYVISCALLNNMMDSKSVMKINSRWWQIKRKCKNIDIFDLKFISKLFGVPYTTAGIAAFISRWNILFYPIIEKDGVIVPISISRDGLLPKTITQGKVYPLKENEDVISQ